MISFTDTIAGLKDSITKWMLPLMIIILLLFLLLWIKSLMNKGGTEIRVVKPKN